MAGVTEYSQEEPQLQLEAPEHPQLPAIVIVCKGVE